jgi:beta-lactamase class A
MHLARATSARWPAALAPLATALVVAAALVAAPAAAGAATTGASGSSSSSVTVPSTPVGAQLSWLLSISQLPLSTQVIAAHFDSTFLSQVTDAQLNEVFQTLAAEGPVTLLGLSATSPTALTAVVEFGYSRYQAELAVDSSGLIDGLRFKPDSPVPKTWSLIERQLKAAAPDVSFLAARVNADGTCTALHSIDAGTPRPLGSMFKLFVLGALANDVHEHKVSWTQKLTVTAAIKVGGSGTLDKAADGTKLTVGEVALQMISVSDNTAADMLLQLVGRAAVEAQVRRWASYPSLDIPFLTVSELFALKYADFPVLAKHYLGLKPSQRAAYLAKTVDAVPSSDEQQATVPRDVNSIEWFASPDDLCRAFAGLSALSKERGLQPIGKILSKNDGGIELSPSTWPTLWFKGGSEPGVLTLGYLGRDRQGHTYVVVAMAEDPSTTFGSQVTVQMLTAAAGAFDLLH